jgi:hypothetical protein
MAEGKEVGVMRAILIAAALLATVSGARAELVPCPAADTYLYPLSALWNTQRSMEAAAARGIQTNGAPIDDGYLKRKAVVQQQIDIYSAKYRQELDKCLSAMEGR